MLRCDPKQPFGRQDISRDFSLARSCSVQITCVPLALCPFDRLQLMCCKKSEQAKKFKLPKFHSPSGFADSIAFSI